MVRPGLCVSGVRLEPVLTLGTAALDGWNSTCPVTSYIVRATPLLPYPERGMMDLDVWCARVECRDWLYVSMKAVPWLVETKERETHRVLVAHHPDQRYISWGQKRSTTPSLCVLREMGFRFIVLDKYLKKRDHTILAVNIPSLRLKWRTVDRNVVTLFKLGFC
ncbi:hypothetical protein EV421DRAFT_1860480 [Armillaria borealis]|uniref:Uncharacterized protein n=1 Tax=Armillaria borealis TaxID=47425 RepID=A0AA39IT95_9AGAR|nr:hypothetical protein EV421DRAFT_1860480 [Armillaria borealis]